MNLLALRLSGFLRHRVEHVLDRMDWTVQDLMCRSAAAMKRRYNERIRNSDPRFDDGQIANRLIPLNDNAFARALVAHLLRPNSVL